MRNALVADLFEGAPTPIRIGRFEILRRIGHGAMGDVFSARDAELSRTVAVKIVRTDEAQREQRTAMLLREARALARLVHPNVATLFDSGVHDGEVFLAMEYFDGGSLAAWLAEHPVRTRSDVWATLGRFVAAGRGLVAAHEAGLVHRDFKPANVLLGADGRVAVCDFGLAGWAPSIPSEPAIVVDDATLPTMATGGTPAYMAPEQFRGEADARADQYAFCVALFEGLVGSRPGACAVDADRAEHARRMPRSAARLVPAWLRAALVRGLAHDPDARFPDMRQLLAAIDRDRHRGRRRSVALVSAAVAGLAVTWLVRAPERCTDVPTADAVWSDDARGRIADAYAVVGGTFADAALTQIDARLQQWSGAWAEQMVLACRIAVDRDEPGARDERRECLERARIDVQGVIDRLANADRQTVERTADILARLPPPARCEDPDALAALDIVAEPDRAAYDAAFAEVARARAALDAGEVIDPSALDLDTLDAIDEHSHPYLGARANLLLGQATALRDPTRALEHYFTRAMNLAMQSGDAATIAEVAMVLGSSVVGDGVSVAASERWYAVAEGAIARTTAADALRDRLLVARVEAAMNVGDYARVVALADGPDAAGVGLRARLRSAAPVVFALVQLGRLDQAITRGERSMSELDAEMGAVSKPSEALLSNLAEAYWKAGRLVDALAAKRRLLAIDAELFGSESHFVAWTRGSIAWLLADLGRFAEAEAEAEAAHALALQAGVGSTIVLVTEARSHVAAARGRPDVAAQLRLQLRSHVASAFGEASIAIASWDVVLAEDLLHAGRAEDALVRAEQCLEFLRRHHPEHAATGPIGHSAAIVAAGAKARLGDAAASLERLDGILAALGPSASTESIAMAHEQRAEALVRLDRPAEAAAAFEAAIARLRIAPPAPNADLLRALERLADVTDAPVAARAEAAALRQSLGLAPAD